jgi:glycosyltransferase involved in cell wall biosynthesis
MDFDELFSQSDCVQILLTVDPYLPVPPRLYGGVERIVSGLIAKLRQRGHTIGLVAHPESTAPVDYFAGWNCVAPDSSIAHVRNSLTLLKASREFEPVLIHSYSRLAYLSPLLLGRIPKIMSYGRHTGGNQIKFAVAIAGKSLTFTGCSKFIANMGLPYGGAWHAIYNFIDLDFYGFAPHVACDSPLVFLSRIDQIKGAHVAIEVAKKTKRRLIIAGNHGERGGELRYWKEVIEPELGRNGIEYVGPVDDSAKTALLQSALAMLVPIQWDEPFGLVFAEALACGTPVISCPRGALPEIVRHGVEGFLINSVDEACEAVHKVGIIDRRDCRRRAETMFSAEEITNQYEALYASLI